MKFFILPLVPIICWFVLIGALVRRNDHALEVQCDNTAKTLNAAVYDFDRSHNKCNIVTQDGKLVSF